MKLKLKLMLKLKISDEVVVDEVFVVVVVVLTTEYPNDGVPRVFENKTAYNGGRQVYRG